MSRSRFVVEMWMDKGKPREGMPCIFGVERGEACVFQAINPVLFRSL